jgi:hypothetical protein
VTLMFAEIYNKIVSAGGRYFDVYMEGTLEVRTLRNEMCRLRHVDLSSYTLFSSGDRLMILTSFTRRVGSIKLTMLSALLRCVMVHCRFVCSRSWRTVS